MSGAKKPKLIEVTLVKPHTHAGNKYQTGAKIHVDEPTAKWLADRDITTKASSPKEGAK